jgi:alkanesulfonate monooxygenase SsuD/methylene tetrahydromethanopterin reductase-like flavin-dependent oxidoreductase (luciferase family)
MIEPLGVQVAPWCSSRELVELGDRLGRVTDIVWVQDQMLARNVYALLGALATRGCGVGTNVTYAVARNPIEMASAAATIAELVPDDREFVLGLGTGGALVKSLFSTERSITKVRESIRLMRALWAGLPVPLDDYPTLGSGLGYRPGATATLTYPVARPPAIVLAGVGPKILHVAAELGDGLISPSNLPTLSLASFRTGRFSELSGLDAVRAARPATLPALRMIYGINVSVSRDRDAARTHARRQLALVLGNPKLWPDLEAVGLDVSSAGAVKAAFDEGLGIDGAAARMSDELSDALLVAGTPEECIEGVADLRRRAVAEGYNEFYIGAPLGPDLTEAAELLANIVIPAVWPERAPVVA